MKGLGIANKRLQNNIVDLFPGTLTRSRKMKSSRLMDEHTNTYTLTHTHTRARAHTHTYKRSIEFTNFPA